MLTYFLIFDVKWQCKDDDETDVIGMYGCPKTDVEPETLMIKDLLSHKQFSSADNVAWVPKLIDILPDTDQSAGQMPRTN